MPFARSPAVWISGVTATGAPPTITVRSFELTVTVLPVPPLPPVPPIATPAKAEPDALLPPLPPPPPIDCAKMPCASLPPVVRLLLFVTLTLPALPPPPALPPSVKNVPTVLPPLPPPPPMLSASTALDR